MYRNKTRQVMVGNVPVGGDSSISIQSMTNTRTQDVAATVKQINELAAAGCEIIPLRCTGYGSSQSYFGNQETN